MEPFLRPGIRPDFHSVLRVALSACANPAPPGGPDVVPRGAHAQIECLAGNPPEEKFAAAGDQDASRLGLRR
ncbi:hypothetical protein [Arthrobacter sp. CAL618]|uniref:hypothetical protein n=1 Tax=Arthrobacter sp. CAL618 TaxID=1055770 RepID=UPI000400E7A2